MPWKKPKHHESGFHGLGGNSFGEDMESGLGKTPRATPKRKSGPKNILDEWTEAAGSGW